jgi:hypothetical protein
MIIDQTMMNIIANQTVNTKRSAVTNGVRLWWNGVVPYIINKQLCKISKRLSFRLIRMSPSAYLIIFFYFTIAQVNVVN